MTSQLAADCSHNFGGDLSISASGDLLLANGDTYTRQRILRRLLTNQGDAIFHLAYGAGLRSQVGQTSNLLAIQALVRGQVFQEQSVAQSPAPTITASQDATGNISLTIQYHDATTGNLVAPLTFSV